ncbi:MAG: OmpH family outer membrane protein [Acidobacteria bacterium]|nr:OmpH family outer membrane protein [Acidobacteriota bacterium]
MIMNVLSRLALAAVLTGTVALAQTKLAVINTQKAMLDTAELKKAQAEMEAKFKPRQTRLETLQREIVQIQNQLQTMTGKLTPQAEQDMMNQGNRKQKEVQRLTEDLQADVDRERQDVLARASQRMQDVVTKLSEEKALDLVVDVSNTVYFKPALDITKDATAAYDRAYPLASK